MEVVKVGQQNIITNGKTADAGIDENAGFVFKEG
jgi:hypothetical protein